MKLFWILITVFFIATNFAPAHDNSNSRAGEGYISEFICYPEGSTSLAPFEKLLVNRNPNNATLARFFITYLNGSTQQFDAGRKTIPAGADEEIKYSYGAFTGAMRLLVVTIDPHPKPVPQEKYLATWNQSEPLICIAQ